MKNKLKRPTSIFLLIVFVFETIAPNVTWALTGGPSQPEVQSFEPIGTTEMVDLFSGDFNYNIPIMDIDGYPINLAYHSGVTMDQEASWVGLGWNLNPGVINRNMRGIPDDFNGEEITRDLRHKDDATVGLNAGIGFELFGFGLKKRFAEKKPNTVGLSINLGINYNNFRGLGFDFGMSPSVSCGNKIKHKYTLGMNYSSSGGATLSPNVNISSALGKDHFFNVGGGMNLNSRQGLSSMHISGGVTSAKDKINVFYGNSTSASYNSFNSATYTPNISFPMRNFSSSFSYKTGTTIFGSSVTLDFAGYYSEQWLADSKIIRKAYGTQYHQNATNNENIVDFNREKDGSFSAENPTLGIPQLTQDLYSYSGQGIGGMFKLYRNDIPVVFDPATENKPSFGGSLGVEYASGGLIKVGADLTINYAKSNSSKWIEKDEDIFNSFNIQSYKETSNPLFEYGYFKNIGEKTPIDPSYNPYNKLDEDFKIRFPENDKNLNFGSLKRVKFGIDNKANYHREERDKRNTYIQKRSADESDFCLNKIIQYRTGDGIDAEIMTMSRVTSERKGGQNSEMTVIKPDGSKYVYGIAAYNNIQKEYSFTNAKDIETNNFPNIFCQTGEVAYDTNFQDFKGIDHHKEIITTPAYAHSYLLTDILSADYQDLNNDGPTTDDYGNYTKINYSRMNNEYKWRVPYTLKRANYNEGLKSDKFDDNANFIYGTKEIWHVHSIEGKNQIAYFYISNRSDGFGVNGVTGGLGANSKSYKLDSVVLFSKFDLTKPIKTAVFEYDYYLCPNLPNNVNTSANASNGIDNYTNIDPNSGKLTLRKVYFKYGTSNKGKYNSYKFDYRDNQEAFNKPYHLKGYDSWGNYKPAAINLADGATLSQSCDANGALLSKEFPYVEQNKALADQYSSQWTLSKILLPSGGAIEIEYESDDYAFVQDRQAMQMYRLKGFGNEPNPAVIEDFLYKDKGDKNYNYLFIEVPVNTDIQLLRKNIDQMYFNVLVNITGSNYEYIRGYAKIEDIGVKSTNGSVKTVWVKIETVNARNNKGDQINPISAAGFNFARLNLPFLINPDANAMKSGATGLESFWKSLYGFWPEMISVFQGQNIALMEDNFCSKVLSSKSWIRLNNTTGFKLGGGCRVKKIISNDNWALMEESESSVADYRSNKFTQIFDYTKENGTDINGNPIIISSGVATYEPQAGGDENPFRELANVYSRNKTFIPDEQYFTEKPYGESYFPSASVGYSSVTVKSGNDSYSNEGIKRNGTGKVVSEFYTSYDFPTIVSNNQLEVDESGSYYIWALLYINDTEKLKMLQSHRIELNDMHGKPKAVWNYKHKNISSRSTKDAYSGVKYEYFEKEIDGKRRLENKVNVVNQEGKISQVVVGVDAEVVVDSREFNSTSFSGGISLNLDAFFISFVPAAVLTGFPNLSSENTEFKSASSMKMVNKYGILKKTIAFEEGATLETENTVFDAQTGEVLVTKSQNEFKDNIYNTSYPAHWVYDGMGQAYKNQGANIDIEPYNGSSFKVKFKNNTANPELFLSHGDLVKIGNSPNKYWVYKNGDNWKIINESGVFLTINALTSLKIMESGRKNMQSLPIATYNQLDNPAASNTLNNSTNILNASVTEYDSSGRINNCFKPIITSQCLEGEAEYLFEYIFTNYIATTDLSDVNSLCPNGKIINIDQSTFAKTNDAFGTSTYKKVYQLKYPNSTTYPVKIFISRTGNGSGNYQFKFGYKFEPLDFNKGCLNYKIALEAGSQTYILNNSNNASHYCGTTYYGFPNSCNSIVDTNILNGLLFIDYESIYSCNECNPYNSKNNVVEIFDQNTGICFAGDLYTYATANNTSLNGLSAPYSGFTNSPTRNYLLKFTQGTAKYTTRNISFYFNAQYLETDLCNSMPITEVKNPFKSGIQNNWKPKRSWAYVEKRNPQTGQTNIRKDGVYSSFDNFWKQSTSLKKPYKINTTGTKWQYTKEVTKYNTNGFEIESKNALGIYNSSLYGYNNTLPIAVANNSKYNQILNLNFEHDNYSNNYNTKYKVSCPAVHQMFDIQDTLIDYDHYHTGFSSYRIADTNYVISTYANDRLAGLIGGSNTAGYLTKADDYIGVFEPSWGKSLISCWVKVGNTTTPDYLKTGILIVLKPKNGNYPERKFIFKPTGSIIDGWQKIEGIFNINDFSIGNNSHDEKIIVQLYSGANQTAYFDDLRIMPFNAAMNTYVYDPKSLKLTAELDDNNYATFYEYDNEGNLIRIKKETENGIVTIKEARNSFIKSN